MRKIPIIAKILGSLLCVTILSGCWDQKETEELAYVTVVGLDKDEENENMVKVTYVIANPEVGSLAEGGGGGGEPPLETISFSASDFITSRSLANTVISKEITYDVLRNIMVSEDFARDKDFIRWMYDITKEMEIRRDINLFVTKEDPSAFVQNNQPKMDTGPHKYYELIFNRGQDTGTIPPSEVGQFFRITEADADLFLGIYGTTEKSDNYKRDRDPDQFMAGELNYEGQTNTTQFAGSAVFKEGKMIDTLTIEETRLSYLLSTTMKQPEALLVALPDPFHEEYEVATKIYREKDIQINVNLKRDKPSIHATVPIKMSILTNHGMTNLAKYRDNREKLKKAFEETLNKEFEEFIKKTQEEYGSEPFGWSLAARKKFRTIPEFEEFDWMKTYPEMDVSIDTQIDLENFGRQTDLPKMKEVRD
ncbi:Ger(x)C family spore germination protein [Oceanobacillus sp. Castelsardo]|uniref:Ger(x)C family spore germination protein n=1 Tax=Oceanobacillus sp. Castelsardo TaxID=1851204 RepID=UPI000838CE34|nr:Ger(x)C family spore germination protein [Oceanobacillus sp. Castelsardo]